MLAGENISYFLPYEQRRFYRPDNSQTSLYEPRSFWIGPAAEGNNSSKIMEMRKYRFQAV